MNTTPLPLSNVTMMSVTSNESITYERPFSEDGIILSSVFIFTFLVLGVCGNTLTIAVIGYYKELNENVFMRFILSLCVSDLISALISWLFLYRRTWGFDEWAPLPDFLCKFYWAADIMTSYVTALHVLSFAILRFVSIQFPFMYNRIKLFHGNVWMAAIWVVCFCSGFIPCMFIFGSRTRDAAYRTQGSGLPDARWPSCTALVERLHSYVLYQKVGYSIFLYGPMVGVVVMCIATIIMVAMRTRKRATSKKLEKLQRKERQSTIQLVLIIISFLLGYVPFTAYEFWSVQNYPQTQLFFRIDYWFGMIEYIFLRFSECLNPLFYNLGSSKVRGYTKKFLKEKLCHSCFAIIPRPKPKERPRSTGSDAISTIANGFI
ncbi:unnamed protein product [Clavelina lepadiformis]|uniref:G-protein coupled receptors family 1 profile domain-containing protein n=1 Tax=Clavelina lepadiformis TaxID=159417 RepID=A0ABP0GZZ7_CLALP